jgi:general stress protein 26
MSTMNLKDLSKKMADIDFAMLITKTSAGQVSARPMSNNGEVDFDGDSYYFTWEDSRMTDDIERDASVGLTFTGSKGLLGKPPLFVSVEGDAELVREKSAFAAHWTKELDHWFEDGIDTPGVTMIKVRAKRVHYWDGTEQGELVVR